MLFDHNYKNFNILQSAEKALLSLRLVEEQKDLEPEKYAEGKFIFVGPFSDYFLGLFNRNQLTSF